jgi:8-oxo-dGTP diphosphatase
MKSKARNSEPGTRNALPTEIAIAVVECTGRYLVGRRPAGVPLAGYAEFPGGKIHSDETAAAAAARECLEETGLAVDVHELLAEVDYLYSHAAVRLHFFLCTPQNAAGPPQAPFHWVAAEELTSYQFPPANDRVLELLAARHAAKC